MRDTPTEPTEPDADPALAYPEPEPHPLWSRSGKPRYGPLTPRQQQHNQNVLLRALGEDKEAA